MSTKIVSPQTLSGLEHPILLTISFPFVKGTGGFISRGWLFINDFQSATHHYSRPQGRIRQDDPVSGLTSAWKGMGHRVAAFKKGPDFIDSGCFPSLRAGPATTLTLSHESRQIVTSLLRNAAGADISVIEGNRGLFDGLDLDGCCSTGELGRIIRSPVILIVDVTMATRTVAALVMGCQKFDPDLRIRGVILNRVAGPRQESLTPKCGGAVLRNSRGRRRPQTETEHFP